MVKAAQVAGETRTVGARPSEQRGKAVPRGHAPAPGRHLPGGTPCEPGPPQSRRPRPGDLPARLRRLREPPRPSTKAWLVTICLNLARSEGRRRARRVVETAATSKQEPEAAGVNVPEEALASIDRGSVSRALPAPRRPAAGHRPDGPGRPQRVRGGRNARLPAQHRTVPGVTGAASAWRRCSSRRTSAVTCAETRIVAFLAGELLRRGGATL